MLCKWYKVYTILKYQVYNVVKVFLVSITFYCLYKSNIPNHHLNIKFASINESYKNSEENIADDLPWHKRKDKFDILNSNVIYMKFNIPRALKREKLNILLIISSAPSRSDRRFAIRDTWWNQCKSSTKVCINF